MLVPLRPARRDDGDEIEAVHTGCTGDARLMVAQEPPEDRREANRVMPPNGRAVAILVVAERQVHLAQVLAVRDGTITSRQSG